MTLGDWRDIVIIINYSVITIVIIAMGIIGFILFRRVMSVIDTVKKILVDVRSVTVYASEIAKPLIPVVAFVQGIRKGTSMFSRHKGKEEKKK